MGARRQWLAGALIALGVLSTAAACEKDGVGHLTVDVLSVALPDGVPGDPERVDGTLHLSGRECVSVIIDGVDRYPLWPHGTQVDLVDEEPVTYRVRLPDGPSMTVDRDEGDNFSALAYVDRDSTFFGTDPGRVLIETPGTSSLRPLPDLMTMCGLTAGPVAFYRAEDFVVS